MEVVTINLSGKTRRDNSLGREFLVAPLTMIRPGVLAGSRGALYYPPEEVAVRPDRWNGIPITYNHPTANGNHVSGRSPDIWAKYLLGHVFNARISNEGALIGDGWFDITAVKRIDRNLLDSLEAGKAVELSTGLYTRNDAAGPDANHNGRPYAFIARDYVPDHLAILPPGVPGACSVADGCGVNNADVPHPDVTNADRKSHWFQVATSRLLALNWCNQYGGTTCKGGATATAKAKTATPAAAPPPAKTSTPKIEGPKDKVARIQSELAAAKQKVASIAAELKAAKADLGAVKSGVEKKVSEKSAASTAKVKATVSELKKATDEWLRSSHEDQAKKESKGGKFGPAKFRITPEHMDAEFNRIVGTTSPRALAKELGLKATFKTSAMALARVRETVMGKVGAFRRTLA